MATSVQVSIHINFAAAAITKDTAALSAYIKKNGESLFREAVVKQFGAKAVPVVGIVSLLLDIVAAILSLAGYKGIKFTVNCTKVTRTKHQAGNIFTVTNVEPRSISNWSLYK